MEVVPKHVITITVTGEGRLTVAGPIHDKILTYGLLQLAMDAVRSQTDNQSKVHVPVLAPIKVGSIG